MFLLDHHHYVLLVPSGHPTDLVLLLLSPLFYSFLARYDLPLQLVIPIVDKCVPDILVIVDLIVSVKNGIEAALGGFPDLQEVLILGFCIYYYGQPLD